MADQIETAAAIAKLLAATSAAASACVDMAEACREPETIGLSFAVGETAQSLADALRLFLEARDTVGCPAEDTTQLQGALARYLEDQA